MHYMELRNEIDLDLWKAVSKKYEVEDYSGSIIDAFLLLTETIRNKSGLEGDGSSLVGQAFGGDNPRIKLNKLQTDSERDIQRGSLDLLKGLYTSIRNPRHHDISNDNKATADSIICFVDYLLKIIDVTIQSPSLNLGARSRHPSECHVEKRVSRQEIAKGLRLRYTFAILGERGGKRGGQGKRAIS